MAFVYKADKKASHILEPITKDLGPGAYLGLEELQGNNNFAPFNSSKPRQTQDPKSEGQLNVPGPGTYNVEQTALNEKIVVSAQNEDIKIVEVPKQSSVFKSCSNRFQHIGKNANPGPGEYNIEEALEAIQKWPESQQKYNMIDKLMELNKYQSIPSIPSKKHTFGYTENQSNILELNRLPQQIHGGEGKDRIGPSHYVLQDFVDKNKNKGSTRWSMNDESRFQYRESKSVGPGQYEPVTEQMPLYKLKQSAGFASKTVRTSDQLKGQKTNAFLKQRSIQSSDVTMRTRDQTEIDSDSEYEYIEDCTPGPGHYSSESFMSSIKPQTKQERFQSFGSRSIRFQDVKRVSNTGPGDYKGSELGTFGNSIVQQLPRNRKPPFLSSNARFEIKSIQDKKPGPQSYNPKMTLQDKLVTKIEKGYRGKFGVTDSRFKPSGMEEIPGPGSYLDPILEKEDEIPTESANFKSKLDRNAFAVTKEQLKKPSVGAYNLNYYDLNEQVKKDEEDDPDLKIPYPGFGSSVQNRFKGPKVPVKEEDDDDDEFEAYPKKVPNDRFMKKPEKRERFGVKAERFNYKVGNIIPGPGTYHNTNNNTWSKRTYNILFAEI